MTKIWGRVSSKTSAWDMCTERRDLRMRASESSDDEAVDLEKKKTIIIRIKIVWNYSTFISGAIAWKIINVLSIKKRLRLDRYGNSGIAYTKVVTPPPTHYKFMHIETSKISSFLNHFNSMTTADNQVKTMVSFFFRALDDQSKWIFKRQSVRVWLAATSTFSNDLVIIVYHSFWNALRHRQQLLWYVWDNISTRITAV